MTESRSPTLHPNDYGDYLLDGCLIMATRSPMDFHFTRGAVMDARRRSDELLDEVSRLLKERRNWRDYMTTVLTVISTQSEAGMRAGIGQLLKQLKGER